MGDADRTREHLEVLADALTLPSEGAIRADQTRRIVEWLHRANTHVVLTYDGMVLAGQLGHAIEREFGKKP